VSTTLMLVDPAPRSRLPLVAALRDAWAVIIPEPDEAPVRRARKERPALVLLVIHRGELQRMQRLARQLKTEGGTPPPVGLLDPRGRVQDARALLEACGAEGYLGGPPTTERVRAFAVALAAGERPFDPGEATRGPRGLLGRLFSR